MRVGIAIPIFEDPGRRDPFAPTYDLCVLAEQLGFDVGLVGHHHFTPGYATAPFVLLGAIAARTERIRLGTGIFLLPLHHPIHVAESVAVLDRVSGGRAVLGVGVGYRPYEFEGFGLRYDTRGVRTTEALEIIRAAWTEERVRYEGRHFRVPDLPVYPKPVQSPHPPVWVGAVARRAQERAARLGDGWISDFMMPLPQEVRLADRYRSMCADAGRPPMVALLRQAAIATDRRELEETWLPAAAASQLAYWRAGARGRDDDGLFARLDAGERVDVRDFARDRAIAGTPADCCDQIGRWRSALAPDLLVLAIGGADPAGTRRSLELFGHEVLPALAP